MISEHTTVVLVVEIICPLCWLVAALCMTMPTELAMARLHWIIEGLISWFLNWLKQVFMSINPYSDLK